MIGSKGTKRSPAWLKYSEKKVVADKLMRLCKTGLSQALFFCLEWNKKILEVVEASIKRILLTTCCVDNRFSEVGVATGINRKHNPEERRELLGFL